MRHLIALLIALSFALPALADCTVTVASPDGGISRPCTAQEETEKLARDTAPPPPVPVATQLETMFNSQVAAVRAQFFTLKAAVKLALEQGDIEAAILIIQNAPVPPELEPLRQQMLGVLQGG